MARAVAPDHLGLLGEGRAARRHDGIRDSDLLEDFPCHRVDDDLADTARLDDLWNR
jgi:hypothetical protein